MQSAFFPSPQQRQQQQKPDVEGQGTESQQAHKALTSDQGNLVQHAGAQGSQWAFGRAMRFPSTRSYLWDRTPAGPQILITSQDHLPHVQVAASVFSAVGRAAKQQSEAAPLQLALAVTCTNQVTATLQEFDPIGGFPASAGADDLLQLACRLTEDDLLGSLEKFRAALQAQLDQRDIARVQQLYVLAATATPAASPAERATLRMALLMPDTGLLATPLYTKRLCNVPLAQALLTPGQMMAGQTGYLSMDQARSLVPLEATDANVYTTPLVGVWVKGPGSVMHPLVAAACQRFAYSSLLMDRAVSGEGAFLLLLCPEGDPVSKCFEISPDDLSCMQLAFYTLQASIIPAAGMSQCPGGLVKADWRPVLLPQLPPLPGPQLLARQDGSNHCTTGTAGATETTRAAWGPQVLPGSSSAAVGVMNLPDLAKAAASPVLLASKVQSSGRRIACAAGRSSAPSGMFGAEQVQEWQHKYSSAARRSLPGMAATAGATGDTWRLSALGSQVAPHLSATSEHYSPGGRHLPPTSSHQQQQQRVQLDAQLHLKTASTQGQQLQQTAVNAGVTVAAAGQNSISTAANAGSPSGLHSSHSAGRDAAVFPRVAAAAAGRGGGGVQGVSDPSAAGLQQQHGIAGHHGAVHKQTPAGTSADMPPRSSHAAVDNATQGLVAAQAEADTAKGEVLARQAGSSHWPTSWGPEPVSPSVKAGVALSNLQLLQHLSTGQLQHVLNNVGSQTSEQVLQQTCGLHAGGDAATSVPAADSTVPQASTGELLLPEVQVSRAAVLHTAATFHAQAADGSEEGGAGHAAHDAELPLLGLSTSPDPCRRAPAMPAVPSARGSAGAALRHSLQDGRASSSSATAAAAAAALAAATTAVHGIPASTYGKSMGMQRYAADAAVLDSYSQEHRSPDVSRAGAGTGGHAIATSVTGQRWSPEVHASPARYSSAGVHAVRPSSSTGRSIGDEQQLNRTLRRSAAAAVSTAVMLNEAGRMLHTYASPSESMNGQQLQLQDPVTAALQSEVERLKQQVLQLQQMFRTAGIPSQQEMDALQNPGSSLGSTPPSSQPDQLPALLHQQQQQQQQQPPLQDEVPSSSATAGGHQLPSADTGRAVRTNSRQAPHDEAAPSEAAETTVGDAAAGQAWAGAAQLGGSSSVSITSAQAVARAGAAGVAESTPSETAPLSASSIPACTAVVTGSGSGQLTTAADAADAAGPGNHVPPSLAASDKLVHQLQRQLQGDEQQQQPPPQQPLPDQQQVMVSKANTPQPHQQLAQPQRLPAPEQHPQPPVPAAEVPPAAAITGQLQQSGAGLTCGSANASGGLPAQGAVEAPVALPVHQAPPGKPVAATAAASVDAAAAAAASSEPCDAQHHAADGVEEPVPPCEAVPLSCPLPPSSAPCPPQGVLRCSLNGPPLVEVVRSRVPVELDGSDSDDSDREFEERLMLKYGLKHR